MFFKKLSLTLSLLTASLILSHSSAFALATISKDPYIGAIVVDADSGKILFEENAETKAYPASVLKLMDLLVVLEKLKEGYIKLDDKITVNAEAAKIGGSQVYLKEGEVFTIEELLYALLVQSANDAATALAIHIAGSKEGFIELMNEKAREIGMTNTVFNSIHGLPPGKGQEPDITTAKDIAILCRELLQHSETLTYTSVFKKGFRNDTFIMQNHNHLLTSFDGCDGLKTGYYTKAGYSIAATAKRKEARVIAVVLGSVNKKIRDRKAAELLSKGFMNLKKK